MILSFVASEEILDLASSAFEIDVEDMGYIGILGHKHYKIVVDNNEDIVNYVWSKSALPLSFGIEVSENALDCDLVDIVCAFVSNKTGYKCDDCEIVSFDQFTLFYPRIEDEYVYVGTDEYHLFDLTLSDFIGYALLSPYPWGKKAADMSQCMFGVKVINGLTVYSTDMRDKLSEEEMNTRIFLVEATCREYRSGGAVMVDKGTQLRYKTLSELTHVWRFKRSESPSNNIYYSSGSPLQGSLTCTFGQWIEDSVHRLLLDLPPLVPFVDNRVLDMEDQRTASVVLKYMCLRALRDNCIVDCEKSERELIVSSSLIAYLPSWGKTEYTSMVATISSIDPTSLSLHTIDDYSLSMEGEERVSGIVVDGYLVSTSPILEADSMNKVKVRYAELKKSEMGTTTWDTYLALAHGIAP